MVKPMFFLSSNTNKTPKKTIIQLAAIFFKHNKQSHCQSFAVRPSLQYRFPPVGSKAKLQLKPQIPLVFLVIHIWHQESFSVPLIYPALQDPTATFSKVNNCYQGIQVLKYHPSSSYFTFFLKVEKKNKENSMYRLQYQECSANQ